MAHCKRCSNVVQNNRCTDPTCPFSNHDQRCMAGWDGHPDYDQSPDDDTAPLQCTCGWSDEQVKMEAEKKVVESGDLYKALHFVGDDPVKAEIEDVLEGLLDDDTMRTIRAVFNLSTGWKEES